MNITVYSGIVNPAEENERHLQNEVFNFLRKAKAEVAGILSEVPNIIPKIPSFGTSDLNRLRL